jgi:fatty acid desaturase
MTSGNETFLQKCKEALQKINTEMPESNVSFDLSALVLFFWASLTLYGAWENSDWFIPNEIWMLIAILVLMYCTGKIIVDIRGRS